MTMPKTSFAAPTLRALALALMPLCGLISPMPANAQQSTAPAGPPLAEPTLDIRKYLIDGNNPFSPGDTAGLLAPFTGDSRALSQIEQAALALEKAFRAEGYVFHRVFVPVQKPKDGEVTLQIIEFKVDKVTLTGNEHFSSDNIRRSLPELVEGTVPDIRRIGEDLTAANANPAKHVTVTFKESAKPDSVDAALKVKDSQPLSYFMGFTANVPMSPKTPDDSVLRVTAGMQHANLFDMDHVASFSYTTDPTKVDKVTLLGVYYQFPIYGQGLNLSAYYTQSDVNTGAAAPGGPDVTGRGQFLGVRLSKSLPRTGPLQQTVSVALDDRHFDSNLPSTIVGLPDQSVGSFPLSLRYAFRREEPWGSVGANADFAINLDGGNGNNARNYANQVLAPADHKWQAWRFGLDGTYRSGDWNYTGRLRAQISNSSLISGEKFSLGGANSVRGFSDARVRGDSGFSWNLEALGPEMLAPQLRPLVFFDGGQVRSNGLLSGLTDEVMSAGVGLRWSYQKLEVATDLAFVLRADRAETQLNPVRLNVAAFYRF